MYFEDSLKKIEEILEQLENGNLPLENALILYKQGTEIANTCKLQLNEAKLKITEYTMEENDEASR